MASRHPLVGLDYHMLDDLALQGEIQKLKAAMSPKHRDFVDVVVTEGRTPAEAAERAGFKRSHGMALLNTYPAVRGCIAARREQLRRHNQIDLSWVLQEQRELYDAARQAGELNTARSILSEMAKLAGLERNPTLDITVTAAATRVDLANLDDLARVHQFLERERAERNAIDSSATQVHALGAPARAASAVSPMPC